MADIIRLLPDAVANQIAAGEVIQRPASVIKELMENSVDAGATHISVWVTDAGKTSIQVVDDGKGMSETDARLSFERHATSKITSPADLFNLRTMGFRGEALPSIAAVAQVEVKTRTSEDEVGTWLTVEASRITEQRPVACQVGTSFTVNNLFYNVPARRRFLKSNATELNNIMSEFERVALVHPEIAFSFYRDDVLVLDLRPSSFRKRIVNICGAALDKSLLPIQVDTSIIKIDGFIGVPESARAKNVRQFFFVNGRYMRHPYFNRAIATAYERLIPSDRQIPYFICFEVEPSRIDVNIHPTKTEIKFEDDHSVWQILLAATREALGKFNAVPTIDFDSGNSPEIPGFSPDNSSLPPQIKLNPDYNPFDLNPVTRGSYKRVQTQSRDGWQELYSSLGRKSQVHSSMSVNSDNDIPQQSSLYADKPQEEQAAWDHEQALYIQHAGRYLVTSVKSGLMIIDIVRAHTRILYDKFMSQLTNCDGVTQGILFTELLQIPATQVPVFNMYMEQFKAVGFDISDLGGGSFAVNGVPAGTETLNPVNLLMEIFEGLLSCTGQPEDKIHHHIAITLAQKNTIKYGYVMNAEEMKIMVNDLFATTSPNFTPDGKPTLVIIPNESIEGRLK